MVNASQIKKRIVTWKNIESDKGTDNKMQPAVFLLMKNFKLYFLSSVAQN